MLHLLRRGRRDFPRAAVAGVGRQFLGHTLEEAPCSRWGKVRRDNGRNVAFFRCWHVERIRCRPTSPSISRFYEFDFLFFICSCAPQFPIIARCMLLVGNAFRHFLARPRGFPSNMQNLKLSYDFYSAGYFTKAPCYMPSTDAADVWIDGLQLPLPMFMLFSAASRCRDADDCLRV